MSGTSLARMRASRRALHRKNRLVAPFEALEPRCVLATSYFVHDLVSDQPGFAPILDPNLVNAWGIALSPSTGGFWVASNGKDLSTIYTGDVGGSPLAKAPLEVSIPGGEPTGVVFNDTSDFVVTSGMDSGPATFIFASESGAITGWNQNVPLPAPSTSAQNGFPASDGAVYKGLALANNNGTNLLYAADFHNNKIDVIDTDFKLTTVGGSFTDPNPVAGYAPFNIALINGQLYVTYAMQDADQHDDVAGAGHGFIDVFTTDGQFVKRLVDISATNNLDSPWGIVVAPSNFGDFSNDLLVGNFGDGKIHAFNATTGAFVGTLASSPGHPVVTQGLWGLSFGNGVTAGDANTLYFAAGPNGESHGLFGKITANAAGTSPVQAVLNSGVLTISGSRGGDFITVFQLRGRIIVDAGAKQIASFTASSVNTIEVFGVRGNDTIVVSPTVKAKTLLDGGAGNDSIYGGGGSNIEIGGPGNDFLFGGLARDILIGGTGHDFLAGSLGDDILIGGATTHDADSAALFQILTEWDSTDSFPVRMDKLRNGTGGLPELNDTTVIDDGVRDSIFGGGGHDWKFGGTQDFVI